MADGAAALPRRRAMCVSKAAVLLVACACMLALFGFGTPAQARIVCRGPA
jgi:hypothetical protein